LHTPSTQSCPLAQSLCAVHFAARSAGSRQIPSLTEHAPMRTSCARQSVFVVHWNRQKPSTHFCALLQSVAPLHVVAAASVGTHAPPSHFSPGSLQSAVAVHPAAQ